MKLLFICAKDQSIFIEPISEAFTESSLLIIDDKTQLDSIKNEITKHDIIFLEWANKMSIQITHHFSKLLSRKKVIVRCHSFEVLNGMISNLNFDVVNDLIFVGKFIHDFVLNKLPGHVKTHIVPNGIKLEKFTLNNNYFSHRIGLLGYISHKKGPMLFSQLAESFPGYDFHIGGIFQMLRYKKYIDYHKSKGRLRNLIYDGFINNKERWFSDKKFILCTSPWESQNLSVMEGMASGLKPLVHDFPGSGYIYPKWAIWWDNFDFNNLLKGSYNPEEYRNFIVNVYNFEKTTNRLKDVIFKKNAF